MDSEVLFDRYESIYKSLNEIIKISEKRVLTEEPDTLFIDNVNFFVKSYLVTICTYLEAYLQDLTIMYVSELNSRVINARIPNNFVYWRILGDKLKKENLSYVNIDLTVNKDEISQNLSANTFRTIILFRNLGIDLTAEDEFQKNKDVVNSIVTKRNNIVHFNDKAMDISFSDLLKYIEIFLIYMRAIDNAVAKEKNAT